MRHAVRDALADCKNSETVSVIAHKYGFPRHTLVDNMANAVAAQTAAAAEGTATEIGTSNAEGKAARRKMYDHKTSGMGSQMGHQSQEKWVSCRKGSQRTLLFRVTFYCA